MSKIIITDENYKSCLSADAPKPIALSELCCAKNDTAIFQILCDTEGKRCILNPGTSPALSYELGLTRFRIEICAAFSAQIFAEGYLADENGILRADVLYDSPQTYDGGRYAPAYAILSVPADTRPGDYDVILNVYQATGAHDEYKIHTSSLRLHVYDYTMPEPKDYRCYLDLWQHNSNIARTYGVELWSDAHFVCMERTVAALAALGQKSVTVLAGDCPWRGWGCYLMKDHPATLFEYSMVHIRKTAEGVFTYDFAVVKRYIELCSSYGIRGDITVYGIMGIWSNMPLFNGTAPDDYPEKVLIRYLDEADGCYRYLKDTKDIASYISALFAFFEKLGVAETVRVGADEPFDLAAYEANYEFLQKLVPNVRFKMALDKNEAILRFADRISDIAASFPCSCANGELLRNLKKSDSEKRILWYVCNIPDKPNTVLHSPIAEHRALGCIGYLFGFDGFLRWAFTCWTSEPLKDIRYNNTALPAGDVNLIYPARNGDLLFSIRYYALQKSIQDYELLSELHSRNKEKELQTALAKVLNNMDPKTYMRSEFCTVHGICSYDYADYAAFRNFILACLQKENV